MKEKLSRKEYKELQEEHGRILQRFNNDREFKNAIKFKKNEIKQIINYEYLFEIHFSPKMIEDIFIAAVTQVMTTIHRDWRDEFDNKEEAYFFLGSGEAEQRTLATVITQLQTKNKFNQVTIKGAKLIESKILKVISSSEKIKYY